MILENVIETDVLVIGGGMAGLFAALKAKEQGLEVILADKNYVGRTGATHFAEGDFLFFSPEQGHRLNEWMDGINRRAEYLNNREWDEIVLKESKDRYNDLVSWGVKFYEEDGKICVNLAKPTEPQSGHLWGNVSMVKYQYTPALRKKALESGVKVLDRIMISELLKQDGKVVGGVGFHTTAGELYVFQAKATVMAAGSGGLKADNRPTHYMTADGEAMAYRAGAEITGKEFRFGQYPQPRADFERREQTGHRSEVFEKAVNDVLIRFPAFRGDGQALHWPPTLNAEGGPVITPGWEAHCGRAPVFWDLDAYTPEQMKEIQDKYWRVGRAQPERVGFDINKRGKVKHSAGGIHTYPIHAASGIWPINTSCATGLPGLYAAGNSCGTMASGTVYVGPGFGICHAAVTGARAGLGAAMYASKSEGKKIDRAELARVKNIVCAPIERKGGFSPGWVTQIIQSITVPYFYLVVKHEERLQPALKIAEFINNHLVPKLMAKDSHEWRIAQETRNMALGAEMQLRASLFRTESRGAHFREDYPRRDDPAWLVWVKVKEEQGKMKVFKEPVPKSWWPDLSKPYEERYPNMLPME